MAAPVVHSNEKSREKNAQKIQEWFDERARALDHELRTSDVEFDYEKVDGEPEAQVTAFKESATKGLATILAQAAAEEAAAKAGK